jgi:hypothetical protein
MTTGFQEQSSTDWRTVAHLAKSKMDDRSQLEVGFVYADPKI